MKCLICSKESAGEVCDQCIRMEKSVFQKEWDYKEGLLIKKVEPMRISVSTLRISGKAEICNNDKGMNGRLDNVSHFILNVKEVSKKSYQGKEAVVVHYENPETKMERYLFFLGLSDATEVQKAVESAKQTATSLVSRLKDNNNAAAAAASRPTPAASAAPAAAAAPGVSADFESKAKKLKVLLDSGILSPEEYEAEKKKLMA